MSAVNSAFELMYHYDKMNAAVHRMPVKFSPLTFALADEVAQCGSMVLSYRDEVLSHVGKYELDPGR